MRREFKKAGKRIASELLPDRHSMAQVTGGDMFYRTMSNYAKLSPANASGSRQQKLNILRMGRR